MTVAVNSEGRGGVLTIDVTGVTAATAGGIGAIANPEGTTLLILRTTWQVITPSTGGANIGIGVAANATTKATDMLNDLAADGAITGKVYNGHVMQNGAKTEIAAPALWTADKFVTITGSASSVGMVARLYIEYVRL